MMASSSLSSFGYGDLDAAQRDRVAVLFADHICNSDPNDFRYELQNGEITGRLPLDTSARPRARKIEAVHIHALAADPDPLTRERMDAARRELVHYLIERLEKDHAENTELDRPSTRHHRAAPRVAASPRDRRDNSTRRARHVGESATSI